MAPDENGRIQKAPLMSLTIGMVSPSTHVFADIREITELAAEERRKDTGAEGDASTSGICADRIPIAWDILLVALASFCFGGRRRLLLVWCQRMRPGG